MKKKTSLLICMLAICMLFLSFYENTYAAAKNPSIKLNNSKATIYTSGNITVQLKATVNGASKKVTWKSSNKKIAAVDSKGKVTAKRTGTVTITAKANDVIAKCKITVKSKKVSTKAKAMSDYKKLLEFYEDKYGAFFIVDVPGRNPPDLITESNDLSIWRYNSKNKAIGPKKLKSRCIGSADEIY